MSTLYLSDLDGTLFNREKKITDKSVQILNQCIDSGMKFSIATARMPYGCDYRLENLHLQIPGILTNGVFLYDFREKRYVSAETIEFSAVQQTLDILKENGLSCFLYMYREDGIHIFYGDESLKSQTQYYSERALTQCAEVSYSADLLEELEKGQAVYIAYTGEKARLQPVCGRLDHIEGINYSFYLNIYNGAYCLEAYSDRASKQEALKRLKEYTGCDEVVVFGDNWNDVPMIEIADRSYAPENALEEIKKMTTGVIGGCDDDGVAGFLMKEWAKKGGCAR